MQHSKKITGAALAVVLGFVSVTILSGPAEAARPARIKGVVTTADKVPLAGIHVSTLQWNAEIDQWVDVDSDISDTSGAYSVGKLESGTYRVRYYDPRGSYATEFYNDKSLAAEAEPIDVSIGHRDLLPAELGGAAHLAGQVTGSDSSGLGNARVTAYVKQDGEWIQFQHVMTAPDGAYDLGGLPGGVYTLGFTDQASGTTEFWNNKTVLADAESLTVQNSGRTDGLNAQLATPVPPVPPVPPVQPPPTATTPTGAAPAASDAGSTTAKKTIVVSKAPRIKGTAKVGRRLRVTAGTIAPTAVERKFQWFAGGKVIKKATKRRLRLTSKHVGKKIAVRVILAAPDHTSAVVKTKPTRRVKR